MPPDNAATLASGADVEFLQDSEVFVSILSWSSISFLLTLPGLCQVMFRVSVMEAGQLALALDGSELPQTVVARAAGTSQISGVSLLRATSGQILSLRNPAGNPTALTITPLADGTLAVSAHLTIMRLGD